MQFKSIFILSALITIVFFSGCTNQPQYTPVNSTLDNSPQNDSSVQTFTAIKNPEKMFHNTLNIVKPREWAEMPYGTTLIYLPPGSEAMDPTAEKISASVRFLPENNTLDLREIMAVDIENGRKIMTNLSVSELVPASLGKMGGYMVRGNFSVQSQSLEFTQIKMFYPPSNRVYVVEIVCKLGECKYKDIFGEMAASFDVVDSK
jgi:hypothetical protein